MQTNVSNVTLQFDGNLSAKANLVMRNGNTAIFSVKSKWFKVLAKRTSTSFVILRQNLKSFFGLVTLSPGFPVRLPRF